MAMKTGFSSGSYFGKIFRRHMNCTPKEYRKN
ncbi:helix-turn-helix domain-containing protein [Faecalicatena orotica]